MTRVSFFSVEFARVNVEPYTEIVIQYKHTLNELSSGLGDYSVPMSA